MASIHDYGWHEWLSKSNFSFLVGASHPDELIQEALTKSYSSLCLNDYDGAYGLARIYRNLQNLKGESSTKLCYGAEIHLERDHHKPILLQNTLVLVAQSREGYRNLCQILTESHKIGGKREAHIPIESLAEFSTEGLFAIQPMRGIIRHLRLSQKAKIQQLSQIKDLFHQDLYFAISKHHHPAEDEWIKTSYDLAKKLDAKHLFSQDVFFHNSNRKSLNDLLHAIRTNKSLDKAQSHFFPNSERCFHHLKTLEARYSSLPGWEQALKLSRELSESCTWSLGELRYEYPKEMIPESFTAQSYLEHLTWKGIHERLNGRVSEAIQSKVHHELCMIKELNFADYFLTVWDIVHWAKSQNILYQGRGSAANSIVCWALFITAVHPEQFDLLTERFMSKERGDPPDIDVDFEHERREEVLQYIYQRYGRARAAMVANIITYRKRGAMRAVAKAFGLSENTLSEITQSMRSKHFARGNPDELLNHLKSKLSPEKSLPDYFSWDLLQKMTSELIGFPRHLGIHSGGFVISQDPLDHLVPQEPATMKDRTVIQWSKEDLESLGFFKIDLLSLGMLTALRKSFESIKHSYNKDMSLYSLPKDDPATYKMIQKGDTVGVFQIESRAQMSMLPRLKPENFYDLVIEVAIIRPGPIQGKVIHPYLRRRMGKEPVRFPKLLAPVLERTLGVAIFQEQAMRVAILAGDFSPGEANELRRHIGVWNIKDFSRNLDPWLIKLEKGMRAKGIEEVFIDQIIGQMKGFANYGFPESHAVSFAHLAYASSYLKCHYPAAFFASVLNSQPMGFYSVHALLQAAQRDGVEILPISVNHSLWDHRLEATGPDKKIAIRLGFRIVHSFNQEASNKIIKAREQLKEGFHSFDQFIRQSRLYRNELTALASSNAFSCFGISRSQALWEAEACPLRPLIDEKEEDFVWQPESILDRLQRDFQATGTSLGPHPAQVFSGELWRYPVPRSLITKAQELNRKRNGQSVYSFGMLLIRQAPPSAKGMVFVTLEDETGFINLAFTPHIYKKHYSKIDFSSFLCIKGRLQRSGDYHSILVEDVLNEDSKQAQLYQYPTPTEEEQTQSTQVASPQRSYQ